MDWLANEILTVLEETVGDAAYIADKREDFKGLDRIGAARKITNLDGENKALLAKRLKVSTGDLDAFCRVLIQI